MPDVTRIVQFDGMGESLFDQLLEPGHDGRGRSPLSVGRGRSQRLQCDPGERLRIVPGEHRSGGGTAVLEMPGEGVDELVTGRTEEFRIVKRPNAVERKGRGGMRGVHPIECRAG